MQIVQRPRQAGKTHTLLKMMAESPEIVMISGSRKSANEAFNLSKRIGLNIARDRFIDPIAIKSDRRRGRDDVFVVDDLEYVLRALLGGVVHAVSSNSPEEQSPPWYLLEEDEANR